jgi:hypothetical protein
MLNLILYFFHFQKSDIPLHSSRIYVSYLCREHRGDMCDFMEDETLYPPEHPLSLSIPPYSFLSSIPPEIEERHQLFNSRKEVVHFEVKEKWEYEGEKVENGEKFGVESDVSRKWRVNQFKQYIADIISSSSSSSPLHILVVAHGDFFFSLTSHFVRTEEGKEEEFGIYLNNTELRSFTFSPSNLSLLEN